MINTSTNVQYEEFRKKREILLSLIQRQSEVLSSLNMVSWVIKVQRLEQRVRDDNFKVFIMGEFKRGKSTFINAMLGQEVLPAYATPCTAIINEVKWGEQPRAVLHMIAPPDGSVGKRMEIPVDQLEDYVVIQVNESNAMSEDGHPIYESPYEKAELFWPLDICHDGVEIIDSPGLNEDDKRQMITLDYLTVVDAVIFVISCLAPISRSERSAIDTVRKSGYEDIFFVCNRINEVRPKEQERLKSFCLTQLSPLTSQKDRYVFFINALGALEARIASDVQQLNGSGLLPVEGELKNFLANERGRVKLVRPTTELKASIREARRTIPEREALLRTDLDTITARYNAAKAKLSQFEMDRANIVKRLESFRRDTRNSVSDAANLFYSELADKIGEWIKDYEIKKPMVLYEVFNKDAQKRVVEEVTTFLSDEVAREAKQWQTDQLQPLLNNRFAALTEDLEDRMDKFVEGLDQVRNEIVAGTKIAITPGTVQQEKIGAMERILAATAGFLLVDLGSAAIGATFGFREMAKSILPQIAVVVTTVILIGSNPLILIPVMIASGGIQGLLKMKSTNKQIRDAVGQAFEVKLRESRPEQANAIANKLDGKLNEIQVAIDQGLALEVQSIRDQVDAIIKEKKQGQEKVDAALQGLDEVTHKLNAIDSDIDELVQQIALAKARV